MRPQPKPTAADALESAIEEREKRELAYRDVFDMSKPSVQLVMKDLQELCFDLKPTYIPGTHNSDAANAEGRRYVLLWIRMRLGEIPYVRW